MNIMYLPWEVGTARSKQSGKHNSNILKVIDKNAGKIPAPEESFVASFPRLMKCY